MWMIALQVAVDTVSNAVPGTPAVPVQETNQILSQLTSAAMTIYLLKTLKAQAWYQALAPASESARRVLHRLLSCVGAVAGAIGIHYAFHSVAAEAGTYVITVSGVTFSNILHGVWHAGNQMAIQQMGYELIKPKGAL